MNIEQPPGYTPKIVCITRTKYFSSYWLLSIAQKIMISFTAHRLKKKTRVVVF